MEGGLGVHQSLQLTSWVVILNVLLILSLLFGSLLVSLSDSLVHLCLHLSGLNSGIFNTWEIIISHLDEGFLENIWIRAANWHNWISSWKDGSWPGITSLGIELNSLEDIGIRGWLMQDWL